MKVTMFTVAAERVLGALYYKIPPWAKTCQSNVERFHQWVDEEFYKRYLGKIFGDAIRAFDFFAF